MGEPGHPGEKRLDRRRRTRENIGHYIVIFQKHLALYTAKGFQKVIILRVAKLIFWFILLVIFKL